MSGLITVEDYNSALLVYDKPFIYTLDCNFIRDDLDWPDNFSVDFLDFEKITVGTSSIRYTVTVNNPMWTGSIGKFGIGNILDESDEGFTVVLQTTNDDIGRFNLEMCASDFGERTITDIPSSRYSYKNFFINDKFWKGYNKTFQFHVQGIRDYYQNTKLVLTDTEGNETEITDFTAEQYTGVTYKLTFEHDDPDELKPLIRLFLNSGEVLLSIKQFKNPNLLNITGDLYLGKNDNKLTIQPLHDGVKCKLSYLDKEETLTLADTQEVTIDLSDKTDQKDLTLQVEIEEGPYSNREKLTYKLPVEYQTISTFTDLASELAVNTGNTIIRLGADLTATTTNIPINRDVIIYGNNKTVDLDGGHFTIKPGAMVKWYNTTFTEGDNAFIQKENSTLELEACAFTSCTSTGNEGIGSCIYCDIDLGSLNIPNDFKTSIISTTFTDCHGAILHGGELNVEDCHYTITTTEVMNPNSPYFLYQTDGGANIEGCIFDADLSEDNGFCTDEKNANLAQCLFVCGENALINGVSSYELQNNTDPFGITYRNQSHIFLKYYYPQLETCVYVSPTTGYETRALCYGITGVDYIYKRNVQVTRASWGTENTNNPLRGL